LVLSRTESMRFQIIGNEERTEKSELGGCSGVAIFDHNKNHHIRILGFRIEYGFHRWKCFPLNLYYYSQICLHITFA